MVVDHLLADESGSEQLLEARGGGRCLGDVTPHAESSLQLLQLLPGLREPGNAVVEGDRVAWFSGARRQPECEEGHQVPELLLKTRAQASLSDAAPSPDVLLPQALDVERGDLPLGVSDRPKRCLVL